MSTTFPAVVVHCDWSVRPNKRWMAVAVRQGDCWRLEPPEIVGKTGDFFERLAGRGQTAGPLLVGFDFPIGLPAQYGIRTGLRDYREALQTFGTGCWSQWYDVAERAEQIDLRRPFYPFRPGGTRRTHLLRGLDFEQDSDLLRLCERATDERPAACMLFWTLGGNQVGRAAISGWRELLAPNLEKIGMWPFDGSLDELLRVKSVVVVETYPGEVYGHLGVARQPIWSKRRQAGRRMAGKHLLDWFGNWRGISSNYLLELIDSGFGDRPDGEDQFDAVVGLLGMLDVIEGQRPDGAPPIPEVTGWEGWILGQRFFLSS